MKLGKHFWQQQRASAQAFASEPFLAELTSWEAGLVARLDRAGLRRGLAGRVLEALASAVEQLPDWQSTFLQTRLDESASSLAIILARKGPDPVHWARVLAALRRDSSRPELRDRDFNLLLVRRLAELYLERAGGPARRHVVGRGRIQSPSSARTASMSGGASE